MPALANRGLYQRRERRVLGLFKVSRWHITRTGEAARADLEGGRSLGREQFHRWVDSEPTRALAFLGLAGSSVLLMEDLHPDIRRLRDQEYAGEEAAAYGGVTGIHGGLPETSEEGSGDAAGDPALDLGALGFDLGAFDGLAAAFSSIGLGVGDAGGFSGDGSGGGGGGGGG
ncbi:MAG: hypothetical protein H0X71_03775 [Rubrobacter sp.]|nr:hypothetical protein [Rubrobacter sp.]